jgi:HEAT repeat protein
VSRTDESEPSPQRRAVFAGVLCLGALTLVGCDSLQGARGANSILAIGAPPAPEDAAELALDPYDADKRARGTRLLADANFGGADVYLRLYEDAVGDEDSGVRQAGVRALGLHGGPEHAPLIAERLTDDDRLVRVAAGRALQRLHNPEVVPALIRAIDAEREEEAPVRSEAAHALGQYREPRVLQALIAGLADSSLAVNTATIESLETLTGQNFGLDAAAWLGWLRRADDPFLAGRVYAYPGFQRDQRLIEYLPFVPGPPNEPPGAPVGMPRDGG